jgi:DNA-binding transcriptional LysR family regulator
MQLPPPRILTVAFVPGVTPDKWLARWRERRPEVPLEAFQYDGGSPVPLLHQGAAEIVFVRLPVEREGLSVIPLYEEQPVVVGPKEHELSVFDEVPLAELDGEALLDIEACGGSKAAVEVVAAGAGLVILPMSLARLYGRKDVVSRPVTGVEATRIGIAWLAGNTSGEVEEFIGIVRGRTERSSRQPSAQKAGSQKAGSRKDGSQKAGSGKGNSPQGRKASGSAGKRRRGPGGSRRR